MLNYEGNLVDSADHKAPITPLDPDPYDKYPSVDAIDETIHQIYSLRNRELRDPRMQSWT